MRIACLCAQLICGLVSTDFGHAIWGIQLDRLLKLVSRIPEHQSIFWNGTRTAFAHEVAA